MMNLGMAHNKLHTLSRAVQGLMDIIDDQENLPEWVQEKISDAEGVLVSVWGLFTKPRRTRH